VRKEKFVVLDLASSTKRNYRSGEQRVARPQRLLHAIA
jgi:hypothetical protein